ncbi:hypothetical protein AC1031_004310 [Aphanomyces cochlioides]|nr:hypothetical protein AC1031_004310 [Aphanomyces cochlioides]
MMAKCIFKDCAHTAHAGTSKCLFHRNRSKCDAPGCQNQAYARNRCVRHGAKKTCEVVGCEQNRRIGLYCSKHADANQKKRCVVEGCDKLPHARGKCVRHGGGRLCKTDGCTSHARFGLLCARHYQGLDITPTAPVVVATVLPVLPSFDLSAPQLEKPDLLDWAILADLIRDDPVDATQDVSSPPLFWTNALGDMMGEPQKREDIEILDALFYVI